jgi:hypothetical protein
MPFKTLSTTALLPDGIDLLIKEDELNLRSVKELVACWTIVPNLAVSCAIISFLQKAVPLIELAGAEFRISPLLSFTANVLTLVTNASDPSSKIPFT